MWPMSFKEAKEWNATKQDVCIHKSGRFAKMKRETTVWKTHQTCTHAHIGQTSRKTHNELICMVRFELILFLFLHFCWTEKLIFGVFQRCTKRSVRVFILRFFLFVLQCALLDWEKNWSHQHQTVHALVGPTGDTNWNTKTCVFYSRSPSPYLYLLLTLRLHLISFISKWTGYECE